MPVACHGNGMVRTGRPPPRHVLPIKRLHLATARSRTGKAGPGAKPSTYANASSQLKLFLSNPSSGDGAAPSDGPGA